MFDLDARIHFHEIEISRIVYDELDSACAAVVDGFGGHDGGFAHLLPHVRRHDGRRRFFDDLLMTALRRAVPFAQVDDVAVIVGHDLNFYMPRMG